MATANGRTRTLYLLVLLLAASVIAMHSFDAGRHGAFTTAETSSHADVRSVAGMYSPTTASAAHGVLSSATATWPIWLANTSGCACAQSISESPPSIAMLDVQGLMAMCLAVIPLLALLLRPAWRGWFRPPSHLVSGSQPATGGHHHGPAAASEFLTRLCVLRT